MKLNTGQLNAVIAAVFEKRKGELTPKETPEKIKNKASELFHWFSMMDETDRGLVFGKWTKEQIEEELYNHSDDSREIRTERHLLREIKNDVIIQAGKMRSFEMLLNHYGL